MESTLEQPFLFFEEITRNTPEELFDEFVKDTRNELEKFNAKIIYEDFKNGIVRTNLESWDNETDEYSEGGFLSFIGHFKNELNKELDKSKNLVNTYVVQNPNNFKKYMLLQGKNLQFIIDRGVEVNQKHPIFFEILNVLINYINDKFLKDQDYKIDVIVPEYNNTKLEFENDDDLIYSILGFLKGKNEKRQNIMSDEDFNRMIGYVKYYVENNSKPEITKKISTVNIPNTLLRYTFGVLHNLLYSEKPKRNNFIEMVKEMFSCFDETSFDTLKRKFGSRGKVNIYGRKYLPDIIIHEFKKKK